MTELAPLGRGRSRPARIFRPRQDPGGAAGGTPPDAHDRHDAARPDGGDLPFDAGGAGAWLWAPYLGAFAEAGMVGACADWFAVVALFRRPLGLPIPHTAVVPENKRRIGAALGRFITNNFLSPRVAIARLVLGRRRRSGGAMARGRAQRASDRGRRRTRSFRTRSTSCRRAAIDEWVALAARRGIEAVPAAPLASRGLSILWAQGAGQTLLDQGLDFVEATLEQQQGDDRHDTCRRSPRASSPNGSTT